MRERLQSAARDQGIVVLHRNARLKWAFSEAAALMIRSSPEATAFMEKMTRQRGKARAVALVAAKIGRAVCWMMKQRHERIGSRF